MSEGGCKWSRMTYSCPIKVADGLGLQDSSPRKVANGLGRHIPGQLKLQMIAGFLSEGGRKWSRTTYSCPIEVADGLGLQDSCPREVAKYSCPTEVADGLGLQDSCPREVANGLRRHIPVRLKLQMVSDSRIPVQEMEQMVLDDIYQSD